MATEERWHAQSLVSWLSSQGTHRPLDAAIHGEMDRISQALTQRIKELAERYETPLPQMANRVAELEAKVNCHLERMGFSMNGEWKMENE